MKRPRYNAVMLYAIIIGIALALGYMVGRLHTHKARTRSKTARHASFTTGMAVITSPSKLRAIEREIQGLTGE